ncbi:hypothetical protein OG874_35650 [Nocardia sp. NBC_00565]|uniref:hypothetical protein n=1 Tax=Nocardia sp. NBC_00565 TaxID=2975993 RepID=UPI002E80241E|nr:hypothetical protein [Nocardia sp. NBC_00565]WUC02026.1 hypothetical protein OG874_35650 [Nocardia sp. NBC_00565]
MATGLPAKDSILAACRGFPCITDHPMLDAAGELAVLHQTREHTPWCQLEDIDWHRAQLMGVVDDWVRLATPVPFPAAKVHTHTMGQVVDQLAALTVQTYMALAAAPPGLFYDSCVQLDELGDAYRDLADDLSRGIRRLPQLTTPW